MDNKNRYMINGENAMRVIIDIAKRIIARLKTVFIYVIRWSI